MTPLPAPDGSAESWLKRLGARLDQRQPTLNRLDAYYEGRHPLAFATQRFRREFREVFGNFSDNWCELVVSATRERLKIEGFRFAQDQQADDDAWAMWQYNALDAEAGLAHAEAIKLGESYVMVGPGGEYPEITVEHPSQVIVEMAPGGRRHRLAALKRWEDEDGHARANVYLPDAVYRYRTARPIRSGILDSRTEWVPDEIGAVVNSLGVVPVIPLRNNPSMLGGGRSDLEQVIPVQNAINKTMMDMLVASEMQGFRQRYATGIEIPEDPDTGEPIENKFLPSQARVWNVPDKDASFGEFGQVDLAGFVREIEMLIQHLAARTRTPPHYLLGQSGAFPSGESLKATETGLVAKVRRKQVDFGEAWEEALRLAFLLRGDKERAQLISAETLWADPESRSEGETVDALVKMATLGVPFSALWSRWGATPEEVDRWEADRQQRMAQAPPQTP